MNSLNFNAKYSNIFHLGHYDLTQILLSKGADVNAMNYDFEFPIHFAAHGGNSINFSIISTSRLILNIITKIIFYKIITLCFVICAMQLMP